MTLDEDVFAKLKAETRRSGKAFRDVVNECLRRGLVSPRGSRGKTAFEVRARDLGGLRPGLSLDNVQELLDLVEGSGRR